MTVPVSIHLLGPMFRNVFLELLLADVIDSGSVNTDSATSKENKDLYVENS